MISGERRHISWVFMSTATWMLVPLQTRRPDTASVTR